MSPLIDNCFTALETYIGLNPDSLIQGARLNSAWIVRDFQQDKYYYKSRVNTVQGRFRRPYDPHSEQDYELLAAGRRSISKQSVFSGYFGYHRQILGRKRWVHNRLPYRGMPFLLADSSTGDFNLNGIHWGVSFSQMLVPGRFFWGSSFFYNVDETHKTVFPKPINKHRDLMLRLNSGLQLGPRAAAGLSVAYFDFQSMMETTRYSLEQNKTPTFFKIRGLDNPIIFRGETSEERRLDLQGVCLDLDAEFHRLILHRMEFRAGYEQAGAQNIDGGAYPVKQGKWFSERLYFKTELRQPLMPGLALSLFSQGQNCRQYANHPDFKVEIFSYGTQQLLGGLSLQWQLSEQAHLSPGFYMASNTLKRIDKFNGLSQYFAQDALGLQLAYARRKTGRYGIQFKAGSEFSGLREKEIFAANTGWYYETISAAEAAYYGSDTEHYWALVRFTWRYALHTRFLFQTRLGYVKGLEAAGTEPQTRKYLSFVFSVVTL